MGDDWEPDAPVVSRRSPDWADGPRLVSMSGPRLVSVSRAPPFGACCCELAAGVSCDFWVPCALAIAGPATRAVTAADANRNFLMGGSFVVDARAAFPALTRSTTRRWSGSRPPAGPSGLNSSKDGNFWEQIGPMGTFTVGS